MNRDYGVAARVIHWVTAVSIVFLFGMSWWMMALPFGGFREFPFQLHKNIGLTLALLVTLLLYVRPRHHHQAATVENYPLWMDRFATVSHVLLYVLIFAVCFSGYLSSSFSGWGTQFWWTVDLPNWGWEDEQLNVVFSNLHLWTCWALLAVIVAHVGAALFHGFLRDGVIRGMLHL